MKTLIVEDNADDRRLLRANLEHHDCEVIEATNGREGYEQAKTHPVDLIISDALMPEMDGFQLLRKIKTDKDLKTIPFVFYSAVYTGHKEAELAISLGAEEFIIKPRDPDEFWKDIQDVLKECGLRKERPVEPVLIDEEEEYLRKYSTIIATKLEEKIRELEKANSTIRDSERCYRNLFNSMRDVVIIADMGRKILDVNRPALRDVFGYETEDVIGKSTRMLYAEETGYTLTGREIYDRAGIVKGKFIEVDFRRKSGEVFHSELCALKLIGDDGEAAGNIALIRDISERKKLEMQLLQLQKMEAIGRLAGGIAHDFNNILTAIIGYASIAQMKMKADDPVRVNLDHILESANRAAALTQSLLTFSRKQVMNLRPVDLNVITQRVEKFLQRIIGEDVAMKTIVKQGALMVNADSGQIEQVLMNLAINARDAMPKGGVFAIETDTVMVDDEYIRVHGLGKQGTYAVVSVSDTGEGMDETTRKRIFEPFFTTKEVGRGTGLGLSIVYGIVQQHNGFVNVYSEPEKGTNFKIYLPIVQMPVEALQAQEDISAPVGGTEIILLAEDDEKVRELSRQVLQGSGYTVITAGNGEEAVRKFLEQKDRIRLVILDVVMPAMTGGAAYQEMKKIRPDIKALFISGYTADAVHIQRLLSEGMDFVQKPVAPTDFLKKVREVLDKK